MISIISRKVIDQKLGIISNSNSYLILRSFSSKKSLKSNGDSDHTKQLTKQTEFTSYMYIYNRFRRLINTEYMGHIYNIRHRSGYWRYFVRPLDSEKECLIFDSEQRSYEHLPFRCVDARSDILKCGAKSIYDSFIFCTKDQISDEISGALNFLDSVYSIFGFTFDSCLSTRSQKFFYGEKEVWINAENAFSSALEKSGFKWTSIEGNEVRNYGPKIDITINDALKRRHQCATIQLDFQLPLRFDLKYTSEDGSTKRPVIIHTTIFGSIERLISIVAENFLRKWPFWLSQRQAIVLAIGPTTVEYVETVEKRLYREGIKVDVEVDQSLPFNKKVRNAQLAQYYFILVAGEKEVANNTLEVRTRDNKIHGEYSVDAIVEKFDKFNREKIINAEQVF